MIARRSLVLGAGATIVTAAVAAMTRPFAGGPRVDAAADTPPARTIHLEAREVRWELAPGKTVRALAYDGRVPGPELRAKLNERLRIVFTNRLAEPTAIHWHGVDVPNAMDGVPEVTQRAVQPGESFVYEFEARPAGTRWYHTHFQEHRQMDLGLAAPLIIEPATPEPIAYDREVTLVLDDWATGSGPALLPTPEGTAGGRGRMGGMMGGMMRGGGMMGGGMMRRGGASHEPAYDTMTINGKAHPAEPLRVRKGERVRLRLINASNEHTHVVRVAGHQLHVTHTDGNPLETPVVVDAIPIAPSERYDAVLIAEHPGAWLLHCTQPGHAGSGEQIRVLYDGHAGARPAPADPSLDGLRLWQYSLGRGRASLSPATGSTRTFEQTLSGGMMGSDVWTINGKRYPDTDPVRCRKGDRVRLTLRNNSMEAHPMHLHGQSFRVLAANGVRYEQPIVKDVIDVEAHMGSAVVELVAHNGGDWLFHCHKPMHMMGGMVSVVKVG